MEEDELSIKRCYDILDSYKTPLNIICHSEQATKVSYVIAKKMMENGIEIDLKSLIYASLLHDVFKIIDIDDYKYIPSDEVEEKKEKWKELKKRFSGLTHEHAFVEEFSSKYPVVSKIAEKHKYFQVNEGFDSWEEKILNYADKLVEWDNILTLKERLEKAHKRYEKKYPNTKERNMLVESTDNKIIELESEIFKITGLSSQDLIKLNDVKLNDLIKEGL